MEEQTASELRAKISKWSERLCEICEMDTGWEEAIYALQDEMESTLEGQPI